MMTDAASFVQGDISESEQMEAAAEVNDDTATNVVLAGWTKAGKSTLATKLLDLEKKPDMSAKPMTKNPHRSKITKNEATLYVTDSVGLEEQGRRKVLRGLSKHTKGKADLLVYCLPVGPNSNFAPGNPAAMRSLQEAYGKGIWDHCIVALTFSNLALDRLRKYSEEERVAKYYAHLLQHTGLFYKELLDLGVQEKNKKMKLFAGYKITGQQAEIQGINIVAAAEKQDAAVTMINPTDVTTINPTDLVAIPAGDELDDKVILEYTEGRLKIASHDDNAEDHRVLHNWKDCVFNEMIQECRDSKKRDLLQYRYGPQILHSVTSTAKGAAGGGGGGFITGAAAGAGAGAILGVVGGPIGVELGAILGAVLGAVTGMVAGGVGGGAVASKKGISKFMQKFRRQGTTNSEEF